MDLLTIIGSPIFIVVMFFLLLAQLQRTRMHKEMLAAAKTPKDTTSDRFRFPCPSCAEMVLAEAKVCRYCGRDLPEDDFCGSCGSAASTLSRATPPAEEIEMGMERSLGARCLILLLLPVVWTISSNVLFWLTFEPLFGGLDNPNSVGGALSIAFVGASLITYWLWRWRRRK